MMIVGCFAVLDQRYQYLIQVGEYLRIHQGIFSHRRRHLLPGLDFTFFALYIGGMLGLFGFELRLALCDAGWKNGLSFSMSAARIDSL